MNGMKVLIIDDDADLVQLVSLIFKKAGAQVVTAFDGLEGISKLFIHHPNLVILDVMMPGINGFEICQRIRQFSDIPLIMLTALDQEQEILQGLDAGADDFLSKPFNPDVLAARARMVMRRSQHPGADSGTFHYNDGYLGIDLEKHHIMINNRRVKLTPMEFRLLVYLARNSGRVITLEQILTNVWGREYRGSVDYVHVYISHLRKKIEENARSPRYICTVYGIGYLFEKPDSLLRN